MGLPEINAETTGTQEPLSLQVKLRERLYDKPDKSGVMQFIRLQTQRRNETAMDKSVAEIQTPLKKISVLKPLPTNKSKASLLNHSRSLTGLSSQEAAILQNIVNRKRPNQITSLTLSQDQSAAHASVKNADGPGFDACLMNKKDKVTNCPPRTELLDNTQIKPSLIVTEICSTDDDLTGQGYRWKDVASGISHPIKQSEESAVEKVPERSRNVGEKQSFNGKRVKLPMKSKSTSSQVSPKQGESWEFTFFKKNKYDLEVPENTNGYEMLIEMRKRLGWVVDIPRHSPSTKKEMHKLKDIPDKEKEAGKIREDSGEFFYCLPHNHTSARARYNPYDLQVVSANDAHSAKMFFTISASYVTMCYEGDEMDESNATPALWWLWERRLFYLVFHLPFFVKFRLWKAFKQWKRIIQRQRKREQQAKLYRSLFLANEVLQGCLIHVRSLCESVMNVFKDGNTSSLISLVELDPTVTMTLQEFEALQKGRCDRALQQLNLLRGKMLEVVWESCATVAEMEGFSQGIRHGIDQTKHIKSSLGTEKSLNCLKVQQADVSVYQTKKEEKGKATKKPLYVEIAEWRKILARLSSFLRCVDYILQELLRHLVFSAAQKLRDHFVTSYNDQENEKLDEDIDEEDDGVYNNNGLVYTPMASTSSRSSRTTNSSMQVPSENKTNKIKESPEPYTIPHYNFDKVTEVKGPPDIDKILDEIKQKDIVVDVLQPVFTVRLILNTPSPTSSKSPQPVSQDSAKRSRDPQVKWSLADDRSRELDSVTESESEYESGNSELDDDEHTLDDVERKDKYAYPEEGKEELAAQQSHNTFVSLSPCAGEFHSSIQSLICYFEDTVTKITPFLREPKLEVFYSPSKYDLHLNIDKEDAGEKLEMMPVWPDLDLILRDDPAYQRVLSEILNCVEIETNLLDKFTKNYEIFCQMVDQSRKVYVEESIAKKPWTSDDFNQVLRTYSGMVRRMNKMVTSRRVAMVQVEASDFRDSCLPYPQAVVDAVNKCLPDIAVKHNEELMTIIKGASKLLDKTIASVEEFVEHLSFLGRISTELSALEKEHDVVNRLFTVARDNNILFHREEMALYQTLSPSFQHLKSTILYCEAKKDENIRKFSSHLDTLISNIRSTLTDLKLRVHDPELLHADTHGLSALETIRLLQEEVQTLSTKAHSYASYQDRFGSSLSKQKRTYYGETRGSDQKYENSVQEIQTDLSEIERDLNLRGQLWQSFEEWSKLISEWTMASFASINVEGLQKNVNKFTQTVFMLEKGLPHNEVVPRLKEMVMDFKQGMPVITSLRNPTLKQRHWDEIQKLINKIISRDKDFTLGNLLEMNIFKHKEKIQEIAIVASNEAMLEQMLQKVIVLWQGTDFRLVSHAERDTLVIYGADDIMTQLEESQVTVGTIRGSRYVTPIKPQVEEWERKLQVFSRTLDEWLTCQRNWLYLEQIFNTPDIQRQLPAEHKLFMSVDKAWKDIMRRTAERPNALKSAITPGTLDTLQMCNTNLEKVQRCLEDYLETKRFIFPRFYFLSNDELLDILAQSKDPNAVQPHLGKCFDNIKHLDIQTLPRQPPTVRSMISSERETVTMPRNVRARGPVEQWLGTIEMAMFDTVKKHMKLGLADRHATSLKEWILKHPGQVVLTVIQIMFNNDVTKSLVSPDPALALKDTQESMVDFLNQLASFTSARLQVYHRMSIEAMLTITVHNRDIVTELIHHKVTKKEDFEWNRQLRYEWDESVNNCQVLQSNAIFQYGYEYLGCSARLVITPLTDRCYLTLTGALHLHLGGSPAGPAGTGKTETVKDLAKAMGKQCVVFNCSEGLDYKMLGKFFSEMVNLDLGAALTNSIASM